ncbi:MAG: ABC transporter substrate-binding protein [Casimicrobiaceae bacterium]
MRATERIARAVVVAALAVASAAAGAADPSKVLRIAFPDITGLDPQQVHDLYSVRICQAIFEGLYEFSYLREPATAVPNTAVDLPRISDGGKRWTIRMRPGIHFTADPAFKSKPRELVAADYVYSLKRWLDPTLKGGGDVALTELVVGARAVVDAARKPGARFDYDVPIEGLRALDRYTLEIRLTDVDYTLLERLASWRALAVAREVIEARGLDTSSAPVGTGPYRLKDWKRGSRIVLEANPDYRQLAFPSDADPARAVYAAGMTGVKLPAVGRIELSIIEEELPEMLAFEQGDFDYALLGGSASKRFLQAGALKPQYVARGIRHIRYPVPALLYTYFNMDDPEVGGNTQDRIALRRAIGLGFNVPQFLRVVQGGDGIPATQLLPPGVDGYDPAASKHATYDPAAARALLDRFGYIDRDGDGYRERPDGAPLTLVQNTTPDTIARETGDLWITSMKAIGVRMKVNTAPFAELLKQANAGQLQVFDLGYRSPSPSGFAILATLWGKAPPDTNHAHFRNADYDAGYESFLRTPPGPARNAVARRMSDVVAAHAPILYRTYPVGNAFLQPWLKGYYPSSFGFSWKYLDIDLANRRTARKGFP